MRTGHRKNTTIWFFLRQSLVAAVLILSACKKSNSNPEDGSGGFSGSPGGDTTQPAITAVAPANNETDVFLNPTIRVTFNKGMNATTVTALTTGSTCNTAIQLSGDNFATCLPMSAQPTLEGSATYRITPAANLAASTVYKLKVTTDAKDSQGRAITADYETTFTTGTSSDVAGTCDTIEDIRTIGATLDLNTSNTRTTIGSGAGTTCSLGQSTVTMVNRDGSSMGFYMQRSKSSAAIYVFTGSVDPTATLYIQPGDRITINAGVWANLCVTHFRKTLQISKYTDSTCTTTLGFVAGDLTEGTANTNYLADIGTEITTARALELADESRLFTMTLTATLTAEDSTFAFTGVYGASSTSFRLRKNALVNSLLALNTSVNVARAVPGRNNDVWEFNVFGSGAGGTTNWDGVTTGGGTNGHGLKNIAYTTGPTITLFNPAQSANYSATGTTFEVTFNQSMNVATVSTTNFKVVAGSDCTAAALTAVGVVASNQDRTFTLTIAGSQLTAGNTYSTCVSTNVQNASNLNLGTAGVATWTAIIPPVYQFSALNAGDALPSGMTVRCQAAGDSTSTTSAITGTYSGGTNVSATAFGVRGLGTDGISVLNITGASPDCASGFIAAVDTAFGTVGKTGITVSFKAGQFSDQTREWGWRLQLSTDGGTSFSDVANAVDFDSVKAGTTVYSTQMYNFGPYRLPAGAENNANVVLRWRYYTVSGSSGNRTRLILDDILVQDTAAVDSTAPTVGTLAGTGSGTQIPLSWASGSDNTTPTANLVYRVYEHGSSFTPPGTGTLLYTTLPGQTSYTRTGLTQGTAYYYRVLAVDAQGNLSSASNEITYTPVDTTAPTVSSASPTNGATGIAFATSVSVTFSEGMTVSSVNTAYSIKETNCSGTTVSSGNPTASGVDTTFTYSLTSLKPSTVYAHCVTTAATDKATSPNALAANYSATWTTAALSEPTGVTATPGDTQVSVAFTVGNGNGGVKIVGQTGSAPADCTGTALYTGSTSPYVHTGLTNGTQYFYRVCSFHNSGAYLSAGVTASATPNNAFNVTGAASTANTTATVTFSAAPNTAQAETAGNYKIVLGAGVCTDSAAISVSAASLSGSTVTLTTASQSAVSYRVCVSNVTRNSDSATLTTNNLTFTGTAAGGTPVAANTILASYSFGTCTASASPIPAANLVNEATAVTGIANVSSMGSAGITVSGTSGTNGCVTGATGNAWGSTAWDTTNGPTAKYYGFTFDLSAGYTLNVGTLTASIRATSTGPSKIGLYYSTDGTSFTQIGNNCNMVASTFVSCSFAPGSAINLTGPQTIRLRLASVDLTAVNSSPITAAGTIRLDTVVFSSAP